MLVETGESGGPEKSSAVQTDTIPKIEQRIVEDELLAARILNRAMGSTNTELAAWAAVYTMRLGLKHDPGSRVRALVQGTQKSEDPLLKALCWRFLIPVEDPVNIPRWTGAKTADPVVQIMAALALSRRGPLPPQLDAALGLPKGKPDGLDRGTQSRRLVERLLAYSSPFDTGPLALALAFVEARRAEWSEREPQQQHRWIAERIRNELAVLLLMDDKKAAKRIAASKPVATERNTALLGRLHTPLVTRQPSMLRRAALAGDPSLRIEALRAIAVVAGKPVAGDFGAAAAALRADDSALQIEGARTFLLLITRTRR